MIDKINLPKKSNNPVEVPKSSITLLFISSLLRKHKK